MVEPNVSLSDEPGPELPTETAYAALPPELLGIEGLLWPRSNIDLVSAIRRCWAWRRS